jgi:hypothetical protein
MQITMVVPEITRFGIIEITSVFAHRNKILARGAGMEVLTE